MTIGINELKKAIEFGSDIEFQYKNKKYTILPWTDDGIVIGLQNSDDDECYKTADDLINNYKVDERPIKDVISEIDILLM